MHIFAVGYLLAIVYIDCDATVEVRGGLKCDLCTLNSYILSSWRTIKDTYTNAPSIQSQEKYFLVYNNCSKDTEQSNDVDESKLRLTAASSSTSLYCCCS